MYVGCLKYSVSEYFDMCWYFDMWLKSVRKRLKRFLREGFCQNYSYVKEWFTIKVGNDSFLQSQFGPKVSETIFQRRVFVKIKMIHISILSSSLNSVRKRLKRFLREGFCQNYSYVKERFTIKVGNDSFLQSQFGPKASETISQRRFLLKIKMIHISILSFSLNLVRKRLKRFLREGFC